MTDAQTNTVTTTTYDNGTTIGSAYPFAHKPQSQNASVVLSESGDFHQDVTKTEYQTFGTSDGRYVIIHPLKVIQREFEGGAQLTIREILEPGSDPGRFNLRIDGVPYAANVGDGASIDHQVVSTGFHTVDQTGGPGTDMNTYRVIIGGDCSQNGNVGAINLGQGDSKTCTITSVRQEAVSCYVFDDDYTSMEGPSGAIFISGRKKNQEQGMACVPGGQFGHCHKWFGRCFTVTTSFPVQFDAFNDERAASVVGPSDAVYIPKMGNQACIPDETGTGACRRWFGQGTSSDGRIVTCSIFDDGSSNVAGPSDAIFIPRPIPPPGTACIPGGPAGICRRWFGECGVK